MLEKERLKKNLYFLKKKYNLKQDALLDYYYDMLNVVDEYAHSIKDRKYREIIPIPSIALESEIFGEEHCKTSCDRLFLLSNGENVNLLSYDRINELIDNAILYFSKDKNKEKELDKC